MRRRFNRRLETATLGTPGLKFCCRLSSFGPVWTLISSMIHSRSTLKSESTPLGPPNDCRARDHSSFLKCSATSLRENSKVLAQMSSTRTFCRASSAVLTAFTYSMACHAVCKTDMTVVPPSRTSMSGYNHWPTGRGVD
jgi:hypothetical protein